MPERDIKPDYSQTYAQLLTLEAARHDWLVRARCPNCGQAVYMLPADLLKVLGRNQRIVAVRMRCHRCGVRARVQPMAWPADRIELRRPVEGGQWRTVIGGRDDFS